MADAFLGEVRLFSFPRIPIGWALCDGSQLPISQNQNLFSLLGTAYGGDGVNKFALPDLRGRAPVGVAPSVGVVGVSIGVEAETLSIQEMPQHNHPVNASTAAANQQLPSILAAVSNAYTSPASMTTLRQATLSNSGGGQPHVNMQPSLTLSFCICTWGLFPSRN